MTTMHLPPGKEKTFGEQKDRAVEKENGQLMHFWDPQKVARPGPEDTSAKYTKGRNITPNPERFVSHTCVSHTFDTNLPLLGETPRLFRASIADARETARHGGTLAFSAPLRLGARLQ